MSAETVLQTRYLVWLQQLRRWEVMELAGQTHVGPTSIETLRERARAVLGELELTAAQLGIELRDPFAVEP